MPLLDSPPDLYNQIKMGLIRVNKGSSPVCRFWKNVNKDGPIHPVYGQCWVWTRSPDRGGYGYFNVCNKPIKVHRFSYEEFVGHIPYDIQVLHKCDNRVCVRPNHLFLGTNLENIQDMVDKNRQAKGETHGRARLTEENIREVRRIYRRNSHTAGLRALAEKLGVHQNTIHLIVSGKIWNHVI